MFVDNSVLVAILKGEPEAAGFTAALAEAEGKLWASSIVRFEVVASLAISRARSNGRTHADGEDFDVAAELLSDGYPAFRVGDRLGSPPLQSGVQG